MSLTIEFSWWVIPTLITIVSLVWALKASEPDDKSGGSADFGSALAFLVFGSGAVIVSLISWLIWALL